MIDRERILKDLKRLDAIFRSLHKKALNPEEQLAITMVLFLILWGDFFQFFRVFQISCKLPVLKKAFQLNITLMTCLKCFSHMSAFLLIKVFFLNF